MAEQNEASAAMCRALGYEIRARRPVVAFEGYAYSGDWLLFCKPL